MLSSWITPKANKEGTPERLSTRTTPRTSFSSPVDNPGPRPSADKNPKRNYPTAYTTPHDAILADLLGTTRANDPAKEDKSASSDPESLGPQEDDPARTGTSQQELATPQPNSSEILFDPFDGTPLGVLVPQEDDADAENLPKSEFNFPGNAERGRGMTTNTLGSDMMWSTLSQVMDIQSQISKMHLEMEGIGNAKTGDSKRKPNRMSTKPVPDTAGDAEEMPEIVVDEPAVPPGLSQPRKRVLSTVSTVSAAGDVEGDEEGVNVPNEEAEKNRVREEEFAKLTTQFEGRKEAINGIMTKLDDLSQALRQFQHLPPPTMQLFPIRNDLVNPYLPKSMSASESEVKRASTSYTNASGWNEDNATSSSSIQVPPLDRAKSETVIIGAAPKKSASEKRAIPTLMLNSMDLETHTHLMDSPASTAGSLHDT